MKYSHPDILPDSPPESSVNSANSRPLNRDPQNENIIIQGPFYRVSGDMSRVPEGDYADHGYETRSDFREAVRALMRYWRGREGEAVEERWFHGKEGEAIDHRHRQLRIRFHDTPGGLPDEAWLPLYLLDPIPIPDYARWHDPTPEELQDMEIKKALGLR